MENSSPNPRSGILIIDDEEMVLTFLTFVLQDQGYLVFSGQPGPQILGLLKQQRHRIGMALVDMSDGGHTLQAIKEMFPELPCCLMSADLVKEDMQKPGVTAVLQKPFRLAELTQILETILKR